LGRANADLEQFALAASHDLQEPLHAMAGCAQALALTECEAEISFASLPTLNFVKGEFERLLDNLIGNAIKYRSSGSPKIHISAERQINAWIFRIVDNGIGFEPQYADKIFCVFQRLHTRERYLGTGIGLALVKKIVERRGGWIWVDSEPGQGSTFFFSVPDEYANWEILPA
jgi:chemotaxis family two-component system sensor kinase Cph1